MSHKYGGPRTKVSENFLRNPILTFYAPLQQVNVAIEDILSNNNWLGYDQYVQPVCDSRLE